MENEILQHKVLKFCQELQKEAIKANNESWGLDDLKKNIYSYFVYSVYTLRIISPEQCKEFIKDIDIHTYNVLCEAEKWKKEFKDAAAACKTNKQ